jgi:hypothetical protein
MNIGRTAGTAAGLVGVLALAAALAGQTPPGTAAVAQPPVNTAAPTVSDTTPEVGQALTASPGTWTGTQPIAFAYQWLRCNSGGQQCAAIQDAAAQEYTVRPADLNATLRVRVTATNASGSATAQSDATARVAPAPTGGGSVPISAVSLPDRLIVDQVQFNPNPLRSATAPFTVRVRVLDTRNRIVSGALVFLRSTPLVTTTPAESATGNDGWVTFTVRPESDFRVLFRPGYNLQFFVRARKPGENLLAGVSTRRLVQVRLAPAG